MQIAFKILVHCIIEICLRDMQTHITKLMQRNIIFLRMHEQLRAVCIAWTRCISFPHWEKSLMTEMLLYFDTASSPE